MAEPALDFLARSGVPSDHFLQNLLSIVLRRRDGVPKQHLPQPNRHCPHTFQHIPVHLSCDLGLPSLPRPRSNVHPIPLLAAFSAYTYRTLLSTVQPNAVVVCQSPLVRVPEWRSATSATVSDGDQGSHRSLG